MASTNADKLLLNFFSAEGYCPSFLETTDLMSQNDSKIKFSLGQEILAQTVKNMRAKDALHIKTDEQTHPYSIIAFKKTLGR